MFFTLIETKECFGLNKQQLSKVQRNPFINTLVTNNKIN